MRPIRTIKGIEQAINRVEEHMKAYDENKEYCSYFSNEYGRARLALANASRNIDKLIEKCIMLDVDQTEYLIEVCKTAIDSYKTKRGDYYHWLAQKNELIEILRDKFQLEDKLRAEMCSPGLTRAEEIIASTTEDRLTEEQYLELKELLSEGLFKCTNDTIEQFAWWGIDAHIKRLIDLTIDHAEGKRLQYENKINEHKIGIAWAEKHIEEINKTINWALMTKYKAVPSDGSCDGCHFVGEDSCPKDKCGAGEMIFK